MSMKNTVRYAIGFLFMAIGLIAIAAPDWIFSLILNAAMLFSFFNGLVRLLRAYKTKRRQDFIAGILSLGFSVFLVFNTFLPEWIIRVAFGCYCLLACLSLLIQQGIYMYNSIPRSLKGWFFGISYGIIGILLLFTPQISTQLLMRLFGCYFLLLAIRYLSDALSVHSKKYTWHRSLHISLPTVFATIIPDFYLSKINSLFSRGEEMETVYTKGDMQEPLLKAMVHIGAEGLQKVGHFTFAYKGIVYSYGNYDQDSVKMGGLMGDGVYFTVPFEQYIGNIMEYEHNTIFEYGIYLSPEQQECIEKKLEALKHNSYRWYSRMEKEDGYRRFDRSLAYQKDYPCRLHQRTGAKFYKIKKGSFKTYWVTGENCVVFADQILGAIGADVLSVRGIVTPGAYFDYLQNEYAKENSPVISCIIHPYRPLVRTKTMEIIQKPQEIRP